MSSTQVLPKPPINGSNGNSNISSEHDNDNDSDISIGMDDDFSGGPNGPLPSLKTFDTEGSINKMPGSSLLRSVNKTEQASKAFSSNHGSVKSLKSLKSDHTYDFDGKNSGHFRTGYTSDDVDEFGEDADTTTEAAAAAATSISSEPPPPPQSASSPRVPAWKLREQARRTTDAPPLQSKFISSNDGSNKTKRSPVRSVRKTSSSSSNQQQQQDGASSESSWFQKLTSKKETDEEKEKRLKRESLIEKQDSSRWGKDILEEDSSEELDGEDDDDGDDAILPKATTTDGENRKDDEDDEKEEDESDTVKKVKTLIEKSFGSALVSHTKKDRVSPDRPPASAFSSSKEEDDDDDEENSIRPATSRGNRWAMMGSAAITSVRNMKKGWGEDKDSEPHEDDPITEGDDGEKESQKEKSNNDGEGDGDDDVTEELQQKDTGRRRSAMWKNRGTMAFTSVRNAWGGGAASRRRELENGDESSSHADDGLDANSVHSDPGWSDRESTKKPNNNSNDKSDGNNLLSSIGTFWEHTRARFDPEVWADPEIQESVAAIEKLKKKLDDCRNEHRSDTRRRERQIENSIMQQKTFLARKLHRQMYGYKRDPFHSCIKEVYEKEILIIVHEATTLGGGDDDDSQREKDDIDELLDSKKFDFDFKEADDKKKGGEGLGGLLSFGRKDKKRGETNSISGDPSLRSEDPSTIRSVTHDSLVPLETKLLRAQHNEWMTDHQMELARGFQQKSVERLYDLLPELRKEHEKLKAIPQEKMDEKIKELEASNNALKEAYQAHVEAQEKLLAIYRERYVPSVHGDDAEEENEEKKKEDNDAEGNDVSASAPSTLSRNPRKRPTIWAKKMGESVRGLFVPKKDESSKDERNAKGDDNSLGNNSDDGGFSLATPISTGSEKKFVLSFGSQAGSTAASGILANFTAPSLDSGDQPPRSTTTKASQSLESAKDSAAAAWTFSQMDKASLPETLAEKRAKRAAARNASSDVFAQSENKSQASNGGTTAAATSRSELLRRARQARKESAAALGSSSSSTLTAPDSPASRRSNGLRSKMSSTRKELSMRDLVTSVGDSQRKLKENDSRIGSLTENQNQPLSSPSSDASSRSNGTSSLLSAERLRISRDLRPDDGLSLSSQHSLHERKPRGRSLKNSSPFREENGSDDPIGEDSMRELQDVDEFGGEAISSAAR